MKNLYQNLKNQSNPNENNYFALNNLAISFKALENIKSEKLYKKCLKIKPDYLAGYLNFANLGEYLKEFEEAINLIRLPLNYQMEKQRHIYFQN